MNNKILIFGGTGLLGSELKDQLINNKHQVFCPTRADFNINNQESIEKIIVDFTPDFIINCLARISVEKCEENPIQAFEINSDFIYKITKSMICLDKKNFIHISTSDVFYDSNEFITEKNIPNPINIYGKSKYYSELFTEGYCSKFDINYNIMRIGWLYGSQKESFIDKVYNALINKRKIEVINNQYNIPVWNKDISNSIVKIVKWGRLTNKIFHFSSRPTEKISKLDISLKICETLKVDSAFLVPKMSEEIFKVKRPKNVCLQPSLDISSPFWQESLVSYLYTKNNLNENRRIAS